MLADLSKSWKSQRYELSCPIDIDGDNFSLRKGIIVRTPKPVGRQLPTISSGAPIIEKRSTNFGFDPDSFTGDLTTSFGFGEALEQKETDNYFEFIGKIPELQSGARSLLVSIDLLLRHLNYANIDSLTSQPQLMYVDVVFQQSSQGLMCGIAGTYSEEMREWLWWQPQLGVVERAMQIVYERLSGVRPEPIVRLGKSGQLDLHCATERPGLHPAEDASKASGGYQFASHNIETPLQMLTLLAGLGALHDQAKKEVDLIVD